MKANRTVAAQSVGMMFVVSLINGLVASVIVSTIGAKTIAEALVRARCRAGSPASLMLAVFRTAQ